MYPVDEIYFLSWVKRRGGEDHESVLPDVQLQRQLF